jgi:diguanylate cyclase (GGDEF)-like protein
MAANPRLTHDIAVARAEALEAAAEQLAANCQHEQAYVRLRAAVELLRDRWGPNPARDELDRLRREHAEAREHARRDVLTASYNRRYLDERLATLLDEPNVRRAGLSIALVDIDHFKQVNDRHGHPLGDRVLQQVVSLLDADLPADAFVARYGGEEFALALPGANLDDAVEISELARRRVDEYPWPDIAAALRVTVSIGVTHDALQPPDFTQLIVDSDQLLYAAKDAGRNAVAYRDAAGLVRLAGAASARRAIPQPAPPAA